MSATPRRPKKADPVEERSTADKPRKPRKPRAPKPKDEEERLDQTIRAHLGKGPADYPPEQWRSLRETLRCCLLYPGRYVSFIDHYEGEDYHRRLVRREVLCVSRSIFALGKHLDKILKTRPSEDQFRVGITYVEPPDALPWV